jgi:hypothetical protein
MCTKSSNDIPEPIFVRPNTDNELPNLAPRRNETAEPAWMQSKMLSIEPKRAHPNNENEEPIRKKERRLIELPMCVKSRQLYCDPARVIP